MTRHAHVTRRTVGKRVKKKNIPHLAEWRGIKRQMMKRRSVLKVMAYLIQALLHSMSPKTLVWGCHCRHPASYH